MYRSDDDLWTSVLASGFALVIFIVLVGGIIFWSNAASESRGINGYGPVREYSVKVVSKHVDSRSSTSSYMVTTQHEDETKVFEVDNGHLLNVWNADEIYGSIVVGESYCFTAKGNQVTDSWWQQYPYILEVDSGPCASHE